MFAVEFKDLSKKFDDTLVLNNISLKIKEGKIYGLLGPNGAGKSTTISIICGLLKITSGEVKIFDVDVSKNMKDQNKKIGYIPQDISVYLELTAYENLKFFGELYGLKGEKLLERIEYALEFTGLSDVKNKVCGKFSGGMKRRLNIACAILHNPSIVIMDEPTVGIDPQSRNKILESVKKLNESGTTIIYTTHYMEEAEALCDEIGIIDHGNIIVTGSTQELKEIISEHNILEIETANEELAINGLNQILEIAKALEKSDIPLTFKKVESYEKANESIKANGDIFLDIQENNIKIHTSPDDQLYYEYLKSILDSYMKTQKTIKFAANSGNSNMDDIYNNLKESNINLEILDKKTSGDGIDYYSVTNITMMVAYLMLFPLEGYFYDKRKGIDKRIRLTRTSNLKYIMGSSIGYFILSFLITLPGYLFSMFILKANWGAKPLICYLGIQIFALASIGIGSLIAFLVKEKDKALVIIQGAILPVISFLGGSYIKLPYEKMGVFSYITDLSPLKNLNQGIFKLIYESNASLLIINCLVYLLVAFAVIVILIKICNKREAIRI